MFVAFTAVVFFNMPNAAAEHISSSGTRSFTGRATGIPASLQLRKLDGLVVRVPSVHYIHACLFGAKENASTERTMIAEGNG